MASAKVEPDLPGTSRASEDEAKHLLRHQHAMDLSGDLGSEHHPEGLPPVTLDPLVTDTTVRAIAGVRSLVLFLILGAGVAVLAVLWPLQLKERHVDEVWCTLDYCGSFGPSINASNFNVDLVDIIKDKMLKIMSFKPEETMAAAFDLQPLHFYQSEEFFAAPRNWFAGLSLGFFTAKVYDFNVRVHDIDQSLKCIRKYQGKIFDTTSGPGHNPSLNLFGQAVVMVLDEAGRRGPQDWLRSTPESHGALLVSGVLGDPYVWSRRSGGFAERYRKSASWHVYEVSFLLASLALTLFLLWVFGTVIHGEWDKAMDTWVLQYPYLIGLDRRVPASRDGPMDRDISDPGTRRTRFLRTDFTSRMQACSVFFVLDHLVGDPLGNSTDWGRGLLSALVDGLVFLLIATLPVVFGTFFRQVRWLVFTVIVLFFVTTVVFGSLYYFAVPWVKRWPFFYAQAFGTSLLVLMSFGYFVGIVLFMMTRLIVDTKQVEIYVISLGTIVTAGTVTFHYLTKFRTELSDQLKGSSSRGHIIKVLRVLGLDLRSIIISLVVLILILLLVAVVVIIVNKLYFGSENIGQLATSTITPIIGIVGTVKALSQKKADFMNVGDKVVGTTLNVI